jgi:hypothetical protein
MFHSLKHIKYVEAWLVTEPTILRYFIRGQRRRNLVMLGQTSLTCCSISLKKLTYCDLPYV